MVTPGVGHVEVPFLDDGKLDLPATFDSISTSSVCVVKMEDVSRVLHRYEKLLRHELQTPSELDRFVAVPEGQLLPDRERSLNELTTGSWIL